MLLTSVHIANERRGYRANSREAQNISFEASDTMGRKICAIEKCGHSHCDNQPRRSALEQFCRHFVVRRERTRRKSSALQTNGAGPHLRLELLLYLSPFLTHWPSTLICGKIYNCNELGSLLVFENEIPLHRLGWIWKLAVIKQHSNDAVLVTFKTSGN